MSTTSTSPSRIPYGYVYRIVNTVNGKTYIGQHILKNESWRFYMGSGTAVIYAEKKYGVEKFVKQLVCYAYSKPELNQQESDSIVKEVCNGHAEYNIMMNPNNKHFDTSTISDDELLRMYLDEKMSYPEILAVTGLSIPSIQARVQKYKGIDKRLDVIRQGIQRKPVDLAHLKRIGLLGNKAVKPCLFCPRIILARNYTRHVSVHYKPDMGPLARRGDSPLCAVDGCDNISSNRGYYCQTHRRVNGNKLNSEQVKKGGRKTAHIRWHVKASKPREECEFCQDEGLV